MELVEGKLYVFTRRFREDGGGNEYVPMKAGKSTEQWKVLGVGNYDMDRVLVRKAVRSKLGDNISINFDLDHA
jgi:hypothetical protein